MMKEQFSRTAMVLGEEGLLRLQKATVAVFGLGGVGSYAAEALARSGVGKLVLVDADRVACSNLNRQVIATRDTIGQLKAEAMKERILSIVADIKLEVMPYYFEEATKNQFDFSSYDYVVDAIDTVTSKITLILCAKEAGTPIISSMGTGNKLDPSRLEVTDLYKTSVCPLARVMRRELRARGVQDLEVIYSKEEPGAPKMAPIEEAGAVIKKRPPGSTAFVPPAAGMIAASVVVRKICDEREG